MMHEAYKDKVISRRQVFHWHKQFRESQVSSVAVKQSCRPVSISTSETINTIGTLIADDIRCFKSPVSGISIVQMATLMTV